MVSETIEEMIDVSLGDNPGAYLLFDIPISITNSLLRHLLSTAKACILALWKSNVSPSKAQWMAKIAEVQLMENLTMSMKEQEDKHRQIWAPYIVYRERTG